MSAQDNVRYCRRQVWLFSMLCAGSVWGIVKYWGTEMMTGSAILLLVWTLLLLPHLADAKYEWIERGKRIRAARTTGQRPSATGGDDVVE